MNESPNTLSDAIGLPCETFDLPVKGSEVTARDQALAARWLARRQRARGCSHLVTSLELDDTIQLLLDDRVRLRPAPPNAWTLNRPQRHRFRSRQSC